MLWELLRTGHLAHWWDYLVFAMCVLLLTAGPTTIWVIWMTWPRNGGNDDS